PDSPYFVAEPEDPTKVRFIAEPEDPDLVCFVEVGGGHVNFCEISEDSSPMAVPGYEPSP
ncbi:MAG: hypothetical protein GY788_31575, partial [bacterium]|nr:hypothetical protein [bacterium]